VASILLVEDDSMISRMLSLRLTMQGHQISLAENGRVGLEMALATPYDLILMDMHMPVMDGHEATRALREAGYTGLIVAVTASVMSRESEAAIESGCDSYISKPVSEKFEQEVQEKLDGRQ
jgi:CheY-like chemotaxis protein